MERFVEDSVMDILIPEASQLDIEDALSSTDTADESALIPTIPQRNVLFFDELVPIYVVLRTPYQDEQSLKAYIARLAVALEAHAVSSPSTEGHPSGVRNGTFGGQTRDVIWSEKVDTAEEPVIVVEEATEHDDTRDMFVIWKLIAHLSRPRLRLQIPAILFKLSASLRPTEDEVLADLSDPFLPSGVPLPANLLQPLQDDPELKGMEPRLSALRLSRALPSMRARRPETKPLKVASRRAVRATSAVNARVRYHRSKISARDSVVTASLDIEIPPIVSSITEIKSIDLDFKEGEIEMMAKDYVLKLPMRCQPRDNTVFFYYLTLGPAFTDRISTASNSKALEISIDATVLVSETCHPRIEMRWRTHVDFSTALNPDFRRPGQSMQRSSRPANLPSVGAPASTMQNTINTTKVSSESYRNMQDLAPLKETGITVTFTALGEVYVGEPFRWDVFIVNHSGKSKQFSVMAIPRRTRRYSQTMSSANSRVEIDYHQTAEAVLDENTLYTMKKKGSPGTAQLVCLTTEIKIGPLHPGACHTAELKFLPLAKGLLQLEAVRFVDIESGDTVDVRNLPDVIAVEKALED
ncbi:MAG: hypothetical protein Q9187_000442 [Circinaria calcarea]